MKQKITLILALGVCFSKAAPAPDVIAEASGKLIAARDGEA
jgi:hypothetical protein